MSKNPILTIGKGHNQYTFTRKDGRTRLYRTGRVLDMSQYFSTWTSDGFPKRQYHIGNHKVKKLSDAQTKLMVYLHPGVQATTRAYNDTTARKLAQYGYIQISTDSFNKIHLTAKGRLVATAIVAKQDAEYEAWKNSPEQIEVQKLRDERDANMRAAEQALVDEYAPIAPNAKYEIRILGYAPVVTIGQYVTLNWRNVRYEIHISTNIIETYQAHNLAIGLMEAAELAYALNQKYAPQETS